MSAQPEIDFWYEFASTYSYPAAMRIEEVAAATGVAVRWRPFLLGPIFRAQGLDTSPFNVIPDKGRYMWRDLQRICTRLDLPFQRPEPFPQNGLLAARIAIMLPDDGTRSRFSKAVYTAEFGAGAQIDNREVLAVLLERSGIDAKTQFEWAGREEAKSTLKEQVARAQALGIFGAPTFVTQDGEMFWGNDRLEDAFEWAVAARTG